MYSAVKVGGVPLYKSARAGKTIARDARAIVIHTLEVEAIQERDVTLRIVCSKGTYVRTLCADIGEALGVGGHMLALERRRVGPLTIDQALTVDEVVTRHALGRLGDDLLSLDCALNQLGIVVVDEQTADRVRHGAPVPAAKILRWEGATGGERVFVRPSLDGSVHGRFPSSLEVDLHFLGGTVDRKVPSFELWSLGGATTVRGFREDSFLGRDLASLQAELWLPFARSVQAVAPAPSEGDQNLARTPVESRAARLFKLALFLDGGYLAGTTTNTTETIAGAGLGIRFIVPHRPFVIRADYGRGLGARGGEWFPYVTLGYRY